MKVAGFGNVRFSLISPDKAELVQPESNVDLSSKFLGISNFFNWISLPSKLIGSFDSSVTHFIALRFSLIITG